MVPVNADARKGLPSSMEHNVLVCNIQLRFSSSFDRQVLCFPPVLI